ncbi:MAG: hypothetical protein ACLQO6_02815 [Desulfomonilaceae bacterium]
MSNEKGYIIEFQAAETYSKIPAATFADVRKVIKNPAWQGDGRLSVVRTRDRFQIFSGSVQRARCQFGL